jgi:endonuclease YncB( thermonuclease family)
MGEVVPERHVEGGDVGPGLAARNDFDEHAGFWSQTRHTTSGSKALESEGRTADVFFMLRAPVHSVSIWLPLFVGVMAFVHPAMGQTISGRVVGVSDGDSLTLLVEGNRQIKVRLEGIDAPEGGQEFSRNAKAGLSHLVFGKDVTLEVTGTDRYERTLGVVHVGGVNANLALVRQGLAWHYKKYSDDRALAQAEVDARASRSGLWAGFDPMPPWEYRAIKQRPQGAVGTAPSAGNPPPASATAFWLNTGSNVRHNSSCRWFGKTKRGRYCGPEDGKACGDCGG